MRERLWATLPGRLAVHAEERGDRVALREKRLGVWSERTWREYHEAVARVAHGLAALGVGPGDHVGILSDNRPEWLFADLAAQALGARSVGIYQTNPPDEVAWIANHSRCKVLICEDQEQVDKAVATRAQTPTLSHVVVIEPRGTTHYGDDRLMRWEDLDALGATRASEAPGAHLERLLALDPDAPAMVVYTSGTTGTPKGALLSHRNASSGDGLVGVLGASDADQILSYLPLCHVAEKIFSLFLPLACGAVVHFGESIETVQTDLREVSPTIFLGVPRIWEKMQAGVTLRMKDASRLKRALFASAVAHGRKPGGALLGRVAADALVFRALQERLGLRRCRLPISGAAPIGAELLAWFHAVGIPVLEGYGQTECAGVSHVMPPDAVRLGTVGKPIPGTACRIADDGEVLVRGMGVFVGYLHDDEATRATVDADGWLHTGDIGVEDADGYLTITGRKKEILITAGGKNLSPERIENALKASPYIKEAVAVGDRKPFVGALIQVDAEAVGDWATRRQIPYSDYADLTRRPEVVALVDAAVQEANAHLARVESVRAFRLLPKELHQDDGELTATQKVRRRVVVDKHSALVDGLYSSGAPTGPLLGREGGA